MNRASGSQAETTLRSATVTRVLQASLLLAFVLAVSACSGDDSDDADGGDANPSEEAILDGGEPVQDEELAQLAFERAQLGAELLAGVIR